jgi:type II secretory pathway component PulF
MKMQLENGQPISEATRNAADCLSAGNRFHCSVISEKLDAGCSLAEAFQSSRWFPPVYRQLLSSAEIAGQLGIGFTQISSLLEQKRSDRFAFWSKFLEPIMMILLGSLVLMVLLAIYLPIFDLGNRIG